MPGFYSNFSKQTTDLKTNQLKWLSKQIGECPLELLIAGKEVNP